MERVEELSQSRIPWLPRVFDEKFRILLSPTLFRPDLTFFRDKCEMRAAPLAVVFLDIDKFKDINKEKGETHVDRHVLPVFMAALEAHVYGRGQAYRFGGDEYAMIFPNGDTGYATFLLQTGKWPTVGSGRVRDVEREHWMAIDGALRHGFRGLLGGSSLSRLLRQLKRIRPGPQ